ncbi:DUF992 domain-containing protein [Methylovirgula sp. 4M-Z18]|nr:DUF992 domain-containing protein [Methylovirgula sp. 4M-Z18]
MLKSIACVGFLAAAQPAFADATVKVGVLRCAVSAGLGMVITSSKEMSCIFQPSGGHTEHYYGTIRKFGIDIGKTDRGTLVWGVFAPSRTQEHGALAGEYVGVAASAAVGVGGGANALVGGSNQSFTLQPFSAQAQQGLDLTGGVAELTLRAGK